MNSINKAIYLLGGLTKAGEKLGVTKGVVFQWRLRGRVPPEYCPEIERLLDGRVVCEQLNDNIQWTYLRTAHHKIEAGL